MPSPNAQKAMNIGQDRIYKDAVEACDAETGKYDESKAKGAKPTGPGPGPLPNTPSPFVVKG